MPPREDAFLRSQRISTLLENAARKNLPLASENKSSLLRLPSAVIQLIFIQLYCPSMLQKPRTHFLHHFFKHNAVFEADPRDIFNFLRTCHTLFDDAMRSNRKIDDICLSSCFLLLYRSSSHGPRFLTPSGDSLAFKARSKKERTWEAMKSSSTLSQPLMTINHVVPDLKSAEEHLRNRLHQRCLQWVRTYICIPDENGNIPQHIAAIPPTNLFLNLDRKFLGILNFHEFDDCNERDDSDEDDFVGFGTLGFWVLIALCAPREFLVLHGVGGSVWDEVFSCPRVAIVTCVYEEARETYEHSIVMAYNQVRARKKGLSKQKKQ